MSDDLIERLREDQPVTQDMAHTMQCALQDEAADRIEELEAKLAKALELVEQAFHEGFADGGGGGWESNSAWKRSFVKIELEKNK
jgi:hypothetical protein